MRFSKPFSHLSLAVNLIPCVCGGAGQAPQWKWSVVECRSMVGGSLLSASVLSLNIILFLNRCRRDIKKRLREELSGVISCYSVDLFTDNDVRTVEEALIHAAHLSTWRVHAL